MRMTAVPLPAALVSEIRTLPVGTVPPYSTTAAPEAPAAPNTAVAIRSSVPSPS